MAAHIPVLKDEVIEGLALTPDAKVIDCTLGGGGHAHAILALLGPDATYLGMDADTEAIRQAESLKTSDATVRLVTGNFSEIRSVAEAEGITAADAILADLGWRSDQFTDSGKGFSFTADEPLLMTYGDHEQYLFTAHDIVNDWEEESIADVIYGYGEERFARRIARAIVTARETAPIATAKQLAEIVKVAVPAPFRNRRIDPATKTFQALRIAVNDEFKVLRTLLEDAPQLLAPAGRMAVISFHSLEDRIVKHTFRDLAATDSFRLITKRPITATDEELSENPRSRSAKLRIIERITPS
ncbi:MAG: 16S rRNA (cytosine(1402)-N(4))-methyltransferase RsmH [Candidatus Paceibacterota bacterium]